MAAGTMEKRNGHKHCSSLVNKAWLSGYYKEEPIAGRILCATLLYNTPQGGQLNSSNASSYNIMNHELGYWGTGGERAMNLVACHPRFQRIGEGQPARGCVPAATNRPLGTDAEQGSTHNDRLGPSCLTGTD